jgi:hypothetical protein
MRRILSNGVWTIQNLVAGIRMLLPLAVTRRSFHFSAEQFIILTLVAASIAAVARYPFGAPGASFSRYGLALIGANFFFFLLLCYVIAKIQRAPQSATALAIATVVASIPLQVFDPVVSPSQPSATPTYASGSAAVILLIWYIAAVTRAIRLLYEGTWRRSMFLAVGFVIASAAIDYVIPDELWYRAEASRAARESVPPVNTEQTYYAQGEMVRRELSDVAKSRPGVGELYFIAFAGTSTQDVFLKEAREAKKLFDASFDTSTAHSSLQTIVAPPQNYRSPASPICGGFSTASPRRWIPKAMCSFSI